MSFIVYLAVLLVAAASAMFGLDLLTSPLPQKSPVEIAGAAKSTPQTLSQRQAEKERADKQANNRALNPVFPAHPGESKDVRAAYPPTNETTGADHGDTASAGAPSQADAKTADAKASVEKTPVDSKASPDTKPKAQTAPATPEQSQAPAPAQPAPQPPAAQIATATPDDRSGEQHTAATPVTEPAARQAAGRCDIQACTQAYSSFRASDCTYQPFSGPRRVCSAPGSAQRRTVTTYRPRAVEARVQRDPRNWDPRRNPEVDDPVRRVQQMPDDDDYDRPRRRVIVIERGVGRMWP
jgi:hypothetical protein